MNCKICNGKTELVFTGIVLKKYKCRYYNCKICGFLQTEKPYWIDEAYKNPINISDTGIIKRNLQLRNLVASIITFFYKSNSKFVDYAGGYGIFTRIMRDMGFDFYWYDPMTENIFAKGFEYDKKSKIELITAFECFEHFVNPHEDFEKMLKISKNIIFTTELVPQPTPKIKDWWYYGIEHGQHVSFYSEKTFEYIASKYGLFYYNLGGIGILTQKKQVRKLLTLVKMFSPILGVVTSNSRKSLTLKDMERLQ